MTHEELMAELTDTDPVYARATLYSALRAVVELHKPFNGFLNKDKLFCSVCEEGNPPDSYPYPCPTIQAIEKELNG